jgi:SSS family solute:Na+ symporter
MSSVDSLLNSTATLFTKDIYQPYIKKGASDKHYLMVGKITTLVLLVLGVITSPISNKYPGIYVAVQTFLSYFQGPIFSILLLGIFWKRTTQWGGLAGLVVGIGVAVALNSIEGVFTIEDPFLYVSWWSFVVGLMVTVAVSLVTRPYSSERLKELVFTVAEEIK